MSEIDFGIMNKSLDRTQQSQMFAQEQAMNAVKFNRQQNLKETEYADGAADRAATTDVKKNTALGQLQEYNAKAHTAQKQITTEIYGKTAQAFGVDISTPEGDAKLEQMVNTPEGQQKFQSIANAYRPVMEGITGKKFDETQPVNFTMIKMFKDTSPEAMNAQKEAALQFHETFKTNESIRKETEIAKGVAPIKEKAVEHEYGLKGGMEEQKWGHKQSELEITEAGKDRRALLASKSKSGNNTKPELKEIQEYTGANGLIKNAKDINGRIDGIVNDIDNGKLDFGIFKNAMTGIASAMGSDSEQVKNKADYDNTIKTFANQVLVNAKGTQTEGDAKRAIELIQGNPYNPTIVKQQMGILRQINDNLIAEKQQTVDILGRTKDFGTGSSTPAPSQGSSFGVKGSGGGMSREVLAQKVKSGEMTAKQASEYAKQNNMGQ